MPDQISIRNARLHNLKNIDLDLPKKKFIVFTGLSGSGKSTLAFDTLHKEGQRQYLESLGLVTDALTRPPVDAIEGLSPSISVDQHLTNRSPRSTVGTATEVYTYLRVLFARLGRRPCPACGKEVPPSFNSLAMDEPPENEVDESVEDVPRFPCPHCGAGVPELGMAHFSFNKPAGACPTCTGLGTVHLANIDRLVDFQKSILDGAVTGWDIYSIRRYVECIAGAEKHYGFRMDPAQPVGQYGPVQRDFLLYGVESPQFKRHFPGVQPPTAVSRGYFEGVVTNLLRRYMEHANDPAYRQKLDDLLISQTCPDCLGTRLRPESRQVTVNGRNIIETSQIPLSALSGWLQSLHAVLNDEERLIAEPVVTDLIERVRRLVDVGVGYLTLDRAAPSLSAGEAQRLRLAALLGSGLTGVLYVLDEPTIGLHQRDNQLLVRVLRRLRDLGNTVLVIEHDLELVAAADYVVDFGPEAGRNGGQIMAAGSPEEVAAIQGSPTGDYLAGRKKIALPRRRSPGNGNCLTICGAREHNLKNLTVEFPLGMLIAVTGVSGSGKSTLMFDILDRAARQRFYGAGDFPGEHDRIEGWEHIDKIITIDQQPIGRTARSNAATYTDAFTAIRSAFAATEAARLRGLTARHFSFNIPGGRCERCEGAGLLTVPMHFLPDVQVRCPVCRGRRFSREVLEVKYQGHDISQVLDLTIAEALPLFAEVPGAATRLSLMAEVGLGYLQLGQPANTLSGGEAQRVKLAKELSRRSTGRTLFLLDEPTTGLHVADVQHLLLLLRRLVEGGNTVIVVEHNLELIKSADWVIDLGPEGGMDGGYLIAAGTPEDIARHPQSFTGRALKPYLD